MAADSHSEQDLPPRQAYTDAARGRGVEAAVSIGFRYSPIGGSATLNQLLVTTCRAVPNETFAATVLTSPNIRAVAKTTLNAAFMAPTPNSKRGEKFRARD